MKIVNQVWRFFSSVKLALFTLALLAATSIIGTLIPQSKPQDFYIQKYGANLAELFQQANFVDMYSSSWFLSLLCVLAINLLICSLDRFPKVWKLVTFNNLSYSHERILKMNPDITLTSAKSHFEIRDILSKLLQTKGLTAQETGDNENILLFFQKGAFSRTGVYIVHASILVIFIGALFGHYTGFKGSIMLPEMQSSEFIYSDKSEETINLGFEVRCDKFDIEFYKNGMVKEFISQLTILENNTPVLQKNIEVNGPLHYKGITFYQSSYQSFRSFIFTITEEQTKPVTFLGSFQQEISWPEKEINFGIVNLEANGDRATKVKIWFNESDGTPSEFWMDTGSTVKIARTNKNFYFTVKQRYATGLQVAKDPGVWIVYIGFGLMLLGLYVAFFLSHRRCWILLQNSGNSTQINIRGSVNKNKPAFNSFLKELSNHIEKNI